MGSLSFDSVFFVDTKKMNPAGGPEPAGFDFSQGLRKLSMPFVMTFEIRVAGLRPRTPPYSFAARQKSMQKNAPDLLALRVPSIAVLQGALAKLAFGSNIPRFITLKHFHSGCVTRGEENLKLTPEE